ncbi:MAG: hypothetical protein IKY83_04400 [Proteobacteria bacterium]|nr:hypothetical protein [Pseudomonadota bacterium]
MSETIGQLDERIDQIKEKLQSQITELVDIIVNDLPEYVLKHIRRAFIEDVDFAEKKSDDDLKAFKARVSEFGKKLSDDVRASLLEDMDAWWGKDVSVSGASKTLDGNPAISAKLSVISQRILEFMDAESLARVEVVYRTPARFIEGKYPPGMIEKYWAKLADLRAAEEERELLDREARKARIAQRWDSL